MTLCQAVRTLSLGVHFETAAPVARTVPARKSLGSFTAVASFQFVVHGVVIELKAQVGSTRFHHELASVVDKLNSRRIVGYAVDNDHLVARVAG
jgi:hypothetical protein